MAKNLREVNKFLKAHNLKLNHFIFILAIILIFSISGLLALFPSQNALAVTASDNFNRADGGLGAGWTNFSGGSEGGLSISSQTVVGPSAGAQGGNTRTGESYSANQYSEIEIGSFSDGEWIGPSVRTQNGGQDLYLGIYHKNGGSAYMQIFKRVSGTFTAIATQYNSGILPVGTKLRLVAVNNTVLFLQDGVQRVGVTDSTFLSGGAPGAMVFNGAVFDNWSGGDVTFSATYISTDGNGVKTYSMVSNYNGYGTHQLRVLEPTSPAAGVAHSFLYALPVEEEGGVTYGDGLETLRGLNAHNAYNVTIIAPSFINPPWYADHDTDPLLRYESFMTSELHPWVEANLATSGNEQHWLLGFSKSGLGGTDLLFKHPSLFNLGAFWDFPAGMSTYTENGGNPAGNYGTDANFQNNYRLTAAFLEAYKTPFLISNRLWTSAASGGVFYTQVSDFDTLLNTKSIQHTTSLTGTPRTHNWDSGWVPEALTALRLKSLPVVTAFSIPATASSLTINISTFTATDSESVAGYKLTESSSAPGIGDAGWTGSAPTTYTFASEGSKTLYAWVKNIAGNVSTSLNGSTTVTNSDTTPPVRSNGSPSGALAIGTTSTTMSLTTDENATCKYSTNSGPDYTSMTLFTTTGTTSHSSTISGLSDGGSYTYYVKCSDGNSNINSNDYSISFSVAADTTPPTVSVTSPTNSATVSGASVSLTANASDDVGVVGVQFKVDTSTNIGAEDTTSSYGVTWDSTGVADGSHSITAVARDSAGHSTTSSAVTVTVDNTAPVRSNGSPSGALPIGTTSTTMSLSTNENATCKYSTSSGTAYGSMTAFTSTSSTSHSSSISGLTNGGSYIYYIKCQDTQTNTNAADYTISFTVASDTTFPTVSITAPVNNATVSGASVSLSADASDDVGVVGVQFKRDTSTNIGAEDTTSSYGVTWDSTGVSDGPHTLTAVARDAAGNSTTATAVTVTVDNTAPVRSAGSPSTALPSGTTSTTLSLTTDENATCKYSTSADTAYGSMTAFTTTGSPSHSSTISGLSDTGSYTYYVKCADGQNNINSNDYSISFSVAADTTPPVVSNLSYISNISGATITWTTDENSSSKVDYDLTSSYGETTGETDTSPRVKNHSVILSNLVSCSTYHYRVKSIDTLLHEAIGEDNTLTTSGCIASSAVSSQSSSSIAVSSGGTVDLLSDNRGITLEAPPSFSSSDAEFQIKQLDKNTVLAATSSPPTYSPVGNYIYELKALSDVSTPITSFNNPITVSIVYGTNDVSGVVESDLKIYRWDGSAWNPLSNCSVNTGSNTVSCTTDNFSGFGLFGPTLQNTTPVASGGGPLTTNDTGGNGIGGENDNEFPLDTTIPPTVATNTPPSGTPVNYVARKYDFGKVTLKLWSRGEAVKELQTFLNRVLNLGLKVDGILGPKTLTVVKKWQKSNGLKADGLVGPKTKAKMNAAAQNIFDVAITPNLPAAGVNLGSQISIWEILLRLGIAGVLVMFFIAVSINKPKKTHRRHKKKG